MTTQNTQATRGEQATQGRAARHATIGIVGHITVTTYDPDLIRQAVPEWDSLDRLEQRLGETFESEPDPLDAARLAALREFVPVENRTTTRNTTTVGLHEYLVDHLDPTQSVSSLSASHLAIGTDSTPPTASDTSLGNEKYREAFDSTTDAGNDLEASMLIDESEANGETYREVGIFTAASGGTLFNHALISETQKDGEKTATFRVVLQFRAA